MREENKNPLIEAVLKMHENNGLKPNLYNYNRPSKPEIIPKASLASSPQTAGTVVGNQMDTAVPRTDPLSTNSGQRVGSVGVGTSAFNNMPKASTSTTGLGATSGEGYAERLKGVQTANPIAAPGKLKSGNLQMGSRGDSVKELQRKLGIKDDGIFGKETAAKLREFQQKNNLKVDAIYGTQTKSAFDRSDAVSKLKTENPQGYKQYTGSSMAQNQITNSGVNSLTSPKPKPAPAPSSQSVPPAASTNQNVPPTSSNQNTTSDDNSYSSYLNKPVTTGNLLGLAKKVGGDIGSAAQGAMNSLKKLQFNSYEPGDEMSNKLIEAFLKLQASKSSNLFVEAKKGKDHDKDGDKDFADVMIARMVASGMSKEEAIAKVKSKTYNEGAINIPVKKPTTEKGSVMPGYGDEGKPYTPIRPMSKNKLRNEESEAEKAKKNPMSYELDAGGDVVTPVIPSQKGMKPSVVKKTGKNTSEVEKQQPANEEVESLFSEAELAHLQEVGKIVGQTDNDDVANAGVDAIRGRHLGEEEAVKRGRGRPKGSKSGSKHGEGGNAAGVTHLVDQIKHAGTRGISDGKGNYMLKHEHGTNKDGSPKVHTAAVPQKAANDFYKAYHNTEKPEAKKALHSKFVEKHFGISEPKSRGISLAAMPRPKS